MYIDEIKRITVAQMMLLILSVNVPQVILNSEFSALFSIKIRSMTFVAAAIAFVNVSNQLQVFLVPTAVKSSDPFK